MEPTTTTDTYYLLAADAVLALHLGFVIFVIVGLVAVLAGKLAGWTWVRNWWFRVLHLGAIGVVVLQAWLGRICPMTILEMWLRSQAGDATYAGSFISHWIESILYYRAPAWVFTLAYTLFAALVVLAWFWVRPNRRG